MRIVINQVKILLLKVVIEETMISPYAVFVVDVVLCDFHESQTLNEGNHPVHVENKSEWYVGYYGKKKNRCYYQRSEKSRCM